MRQIAYDECHEEFTRSRGTYLSLTVFKWIWYFAGHECIRVLVEGAQAGMSAEIVPPTLILGAGVIGRITQCTTARRVEFCSWSV